MKNENFSSFIEISTISVKIGQKKVELISRWANPRLGIYAVVYDISLFQRRKQNLKIATEYMDRI